MNAPTEPKEPERIEPQARALVQKIVVESNVPALDTGMFEHMVRIARLMASSNLVPAHLNAWVRDSSGERRMELSEAQANCLLVVNQAVRWRMDPFAVAQHVYVQQGRIGYEGKLVAAVVNTHPALERRLRYEFSGQGNDRQVTVTGKIKGDPDERSVTGKVSDWATKKKGSDNWTDAWTRNTDQMLVYRGAREWARRWMPEAILGVYADEELEYDNAGTQAESAPAPERSAASRFAAATGATKPPEEPKAAATQAGSEQTSTGTPDQSAGMSAAPAKGDKGTPALKQKYLDVFGKLTDAEVLSLKMDEVRFLKWSKADLTELETAFAHRMQELRDG